MHSLQNKLAMVTGAGSGIGRALAIELAAAGMRLLLVDIDEDHLAQTAAEVANHHDAEVKLYTADLADLGQVAQLAEFARQLPGGVDVLVNNAGVAYYGTTDEMTREQLEKLVSVNLLAPLHLTRELLPTLLARPESHVLNVCSVAGLVGVTRLAAYNATKFALVGFSESIRSEFAGRNLGVTALCPGLVRTRIFDVAMTSPERRKPRFPRWITATPERVARRGVKAIRRNQGLVVVSGSARVVVWIKRLAPSFFVRLQCFRRPRLPEPIPLQNTPVAEPPIRRVA